MNMNWRLASRLSVVILALLVVVTIALLNWRHVTGAPVATNARNEISGLHGTDLGRVPAHDFHLTDQFGRPVALSQFAGKPVVLTFMYTHCPDVCPLMAEKLHSVMLDLGNDAGRVAVIAISVDPKGDTVAAALNFSQVHRMVQYWHFLVGTRAELAPVWSAYAIDAQSQVATVSMHTAVLFVIDQQGRERVLLDQDFTPAQLTSNLKTLLSE
jgi:protein SCO1